MNRLIIYVRNSPVPRKIRRQFFNSGHVHQSGDQLGIDASYESLVDNLDIISDMSNIEDGVVRQQRMRAQAQGRQG